MTKLWAAVVGAAPQLAGWIGRGSGGLDVARLPRPAWPIVAGAVARAITERGVSVVILVPGPDRFADELGACRVGGRKRRNAPPVRSGEPALGDAHPGGDHPHRPRALDRARARRGSGRPSQAVRFARQVAG